MAAPSQQQQQLQFQPFSSAVDVSFWSALGKAKLDVYHLDDTSKKVVAAFQTSGHAQVPSQLCIGSYSLIDGVSSPPPLPSGMAGVSFGTLRNANTMDDFRRFDAKQMLEQMRAEMWTQIKQHIAAAEQSSASSAAAAGPSSLTRVLSRFMLLSFADLKSHRYAYWFCFPALVVDGLAVRTAPQTPPQRMADALGEAACTQLLQEYNAFARAHPILPAVQSKLSSNDSDASSSAATGPSENYFVVEQRTAADGSVAVAVHPIDSFGALHAAAAAGSGSRVFLAFIDPCPLESHPGWPARSLLAYVWLRWGIAGRVDLLAFRDADAARVLDSAGGQVNCSKLGSMIFPLVLDPAPGLDRSAVLRSAEGPKVVGWERGADGKSTPRLIDLGALMDPLRLAESSVDLNLKLMRWRALPALDMPLLARTRCLLLGAGTLGCNVARALLAWGVRHITLLDSGRVSYSNPVRQSLFEFDDCKGGGKPKAAAAAAALKRIYPAVESEGIQLSIPMPGHAVSPAEESSVRGDIARLEALVAASDVVFLLTDSRESRWLPTLMCARQGKICINAALGFDTYVVMRHGDNYEKYKEAAAASASSSSSSSSSAVAPSVSSLRDPSDLGCYFCNDVVAPADSLSDRTLDQACTVTRPGLAFVSAALAVELAVSLLHHPLGSRAPADVDSSTAQSQHGDGGEGGSPLGLVPHQLRGFLGRFNQTLVQGQAFPKCTACSLAVLQQYERDGADFVLRALNGPPKFLEDVSGLTELKAAAEAAIADMEMRDEEDDEGDDF